MSASRAYYPLVGLLLGLVLVGLEAAFSRIFPVYLTGAILVVTLVAVTGGLHLDGLMDTCDGLVGGYSKQRRLEIMRDSHVGAFAVAGAVSVVLLKWAAVLSLLSLTESETDLPWRGLGLLLFPVLSRWAMVLQLSAFPYARAEGLGLAFQQGARLAPASVATAVALVASLLIAGWGGLILLAMVGSLAWVLGRGMVSLLGGLTGDTYGASNEIAEVVALAATVALMPHGLITPLHELLWA